MTEARRIAILVGVRLSTSGRVHYFDPGDFELAVGDRVLVETVDGVRRGEVVIAASQVLYSDLRGELDRIVGRPDPADDESAPTGPRG